jgi:predicted transcriptional regulator
MYVIQNNVSIEYLRYWIFTNIIHINHIMQFMQLLYELMKNKFHTKFAWIYEMS